MRCGGVGGEENRVGCGPAQPFPVGRSEVALELDRLAQDQRPHIAVGRLLSELAVDASLVLGHDRLVGRQRVDGKEPGRMAGQAVGRHHANPAIGSIFLAVLAASRQVIAQ